MFFQAHSQNLDTKTEAMIEEVNKAVGRDICMDSDVTVVSGTSLMIIDGRQVRRCFFSFIHLISSSSIDYRSGRSLLNFKLCDWLCEFQKTNYCFAVCIVFLRHCWKSATAVT